MRYGTGLVSLAHDPQGGWRATSRDGPSATFSAVVLAMPPNNALRIKRPGSQQQSKTAAQLQGVRWRSRFSLALFFSHDESASVRTIVLAGNSGGAIRKFDAAASPVLALLSLECQKRRRHPGDDLGAAVLVLQSSPLFWARVGANRSQQLVTARARTTA